jgi:hypothetical protein
LDFFKNECHSPRTLKKGKKRAKVQGNAYRRNHRRRWLLFRDRKNRERKRGLRRGPRGLSSLEVWFHLNDHTRESVRYTPEHQLIIDLPATLDFEENYESTASHFQLLRLASKYPGRLKSLKFNKIRSISPSAALVLASEVDRWNQRVKGHLKAAVDSWHEDIERLLFQMGYFELLNLPHPTELSATKSTTFLKFKRGDQNNPDAGKIPQQLRVEIEKIVGFKIRKQLLYEGLSEAITNVTQHAYPKSAYGSKQWWLSASYNKESNTLCVMFYDQGVGIPITLPSSEAFEYLWEILKLMKDSQKIEAAMKIGRSSTEEPERGKGLQNLVEFAQTYSEGILSIYSLRGLYRMVSKRSNENPVTTTHRKDHATSVGGTLIEWMVKLDF